MRSKNPSGTGFTEFGRAIVGDWFAGMSGPLSVPAAAATLWVTNDTAKVLLGMTAFLCLWATAYAVWKPEREKVIELENVRNAADTAKQTLLDEIGELRVELGGLRIEIEQDRGPKTVSEAEWQKRFDILQEKIATRIEQFAYKAEAHAYRHRGNIQRAISPYGGFLNSLTLDLCIHDLDYLQNFIHDYSRHKERKT